MSKPRYIAHTTGKQPESPGVSVLIFIRAGVVLKGKVRDFWWGKSGALGDIIAYRVIKE